MNISILEESRSQRLKNSTRETHEIVDRSIMEAASFADVRGYKNFLKVQYLFHRDIGALYIDPALEALLPGLGTRCRLPFLIADLGDLGMDCRDASKPLFGGVSPEDVPTALGWLYVAEGSNMGAAILRKQARKIGLSDSFGARHLAPAPEGPAPHWRAFTAALDAVALDPEAEMRVTNGANAAFARVRALVDICIG